MSRLSLDLAVPAAPASIADWEELLIRFELGPRALRLAADDRGRDEVARRVFDHLAEVEAQAAEWFGVDPAVAGEGEGEARFTRLRAHDFARIQRRGPAEAERALQLPGGAEATVYQIVTAVVRHDADHLAELRNGEPDS